MRHDDSNLSLDGVPVFLHGWFWWPHSLCGREPRSNRALRWTRRWLQHQHAMSARLL